jgi:O-antigen/teichoic acid export membrane protein
MFQSPEYSELIKLAMLTSILGAAIDPWLAYLRMEEMAFKYLCLTLSFTILKMALTAVLVLNLEMGFWGLVLAGTICAIMNLILSWFFVGRKINCRVDLKLFFPLVRIGFPSIFGLFALLGN